jgi:hypothetical protein
MLLAFKRGKVKSLTVGDRSPTPLASTTLAQQPRQLGDVRRDPPRFILP